MCAYTRALRALVYAPLQLGSGMAIPATLRAHIPARGARGRGALMEASVSTDAAATNETDLNQLNINK